MSRPRRITVAAASATVLALGLATTLTGAADAAPASTKKIELKTSPGAVKNHAYTAGRYIVTLVGEPAASYTGGVAGYAATAPAKGKKLDPTRTEVVRYRSYLKGQQAKVAAAAGATVVRNLTVATNGFTAQLTAAQATKLAGDKRVLYLAKNEKRQMLTNVSSEFLGLTGSGGSNYLGLGSANAGKGVIVGVIDSGIWPESTSFAGSALKRTAAGLPVPASGLAGTWWGPCVQGTNFSSQSCNDKLIGARYYIDGFGVKNLAKDEYLSPRDGSGHGSHTASTAAGNVVSGVSIDGTPMGTVRGMAPAAKVAAYKVCWEGKPGVDAGCTTEDIVAAIDDAVADGVDVINFSVGGGSESSLLDPAELGFLRAWRANVFVAASAGNSGPGASTFDHPSPWLTTVAASTFRQADLKVTLGNGESFIGTSVSPGPFPKDAPFIASVNAGVAGATADQARLCFPGALDPAKVSGKVVQCDRGTIARIDKSSAVKAAGGVAMVLVNKTQGSLDPDFHFVPTVHLSDTAYAAVTGYAKTSGATVTFSVPGKGDPVTPTPIVAGFSSRGPSLGMGGDVLKPDLAAPGVGVLAAVSPPHNYGRSYDFYSGTSMSSPHVAGLAALLRSKHKDWAPSAVKSALMTTGRDHADFEGIKGDDPFAQGAGFVQPNKADNPGLVYTQTYQDMKNFLEGQFPGLGIPGTTPIKGNDLNLASIAEGAMAGTFTVTRTVTNIGPAATYTASVDLPGVDVVVSPSTLTLATGASKSFTVTFTAAGAELGTYATGFLTWTDGTHKVRSPLAVKPVAISAPGEVSGSGASGSQPFEVTPGATGDIATSVVGLAAATPQADKVTTGAFDIDHPAASAATKAYTVVVGADTTLTRIDVNATSDTDDLDLYVYDKDGELVALSASSSGDEQVTEVGLPAGTYTAYVNGYATGGGGNYALTTWTVGSTDAGNASVTPDPASGTLGEPTSLTLSWTGLDTTKRWLGWIGYTVDGTDAPDVTVVSIG